MKHTIPTLALLTILTGCASDADIASQNLSKAADTFEIHRRIIFYNGITSEYILEIQGLCSLGNTDKPKQLTVTCKTAPNVFKKHFLGLSDNVTYIAEQLEPTAVSVNQYKVIFKPSSIVPDIERR